MWMVGVARESFEKSRSWWHVYLDNFAAAEAVFDVPLGSQGGDLLHQLAEKSWADSGVLSSDKKRQRGVEVAQELGAFIDGPSQIIGSSPQRILRLAHATLWVLHQPFLSKKILQVILGRWVHVMQFRRPAMSLLNDSWRFISGKNHESETSSFSQTGVIFVTMCSPPSSYFPRKFNQQGNDCLRCLIQGGSCGIGTRAFLSGKGLL